MTQEEALRMALEAIEYVHDTGDTQTFDMCYAKPALAAIKESLAQTQEPVAWMFQHDETGRMNYVSNDGIHDPTMFLGMNPRYALVCPLYTTPPRRTWVDLTRAQFAEILCDDRWQGRPELMLLQAQSKLKEKNT